MPASSTPLNQLPVSLLLSSKPLLSRMLYASSFFVHLFLLTASLSMPLFPFGRIPSALLALFSALASPICTSLCRTTIGIIAVLDNDMDK